MVDKLRNVKVRYRERTTAPGGMRGRVDAAEKKLKQANEQLVEAERHRNTDRLTGLPTMIVLLERLELIEGLRKKGKIPGWVVVAFDLNGFKALNDQHGHDNGDLAIKDFAKALTTSLRESDKVFSNDGGEGEDLKIDPARRQAGGDEFFVVLVGEPDVLREKIVDRENGIVGRVFANLKQIVEKERAGSYQWEVISNSGERVEYTDGVPWYAAYGVVGSDDIESQSCDGIGACVAKAEELASEQKIEFGVRRGNNK